MLARIQSNKNAHSLLAWMQNFTAAFKDNLSVSNKLNILLPYNLAIIHLCIYPSELKTNVHTKICIQMFIGAYHNYQKMKATKMSFSR